jgi:hypothetical protein
MAATCPLTTTELSSVTAAAVKSHDNALPAPVVGGPDGISIPNSGIPAANTAFKRLEWMLVTVEEPLVVGSTNRGRPQTMVS